MSLIHLENPQLKVFQGKNEKNVYEKCFFGLESHLLESSWVKDKYEKKAPYEISKGATATILISN